MTRLKEYAAKLNCYEDMMLDIFLPMGLGTLSVINGYNTLDCLVKAENLKTATLQAELAKAPVITEQVYITAREVAEKAASHDFYAGLLSAVAAGVTGAVAIYLFLRD